MGGLLEAMGRCVSFFFYFSLYFLSLALKLALGVMQQYRQCPIMHSVAG